MNFFHKTKLFYFYIGLLFLAGCASQIIGDASTELNACDYKDGEIILIKPIATGAGDGRYEAGDIVEIRNGRELCERFGNRDFLGKSEKTDFLIVYLGTNLTDSQKEKLIEPEQEIIIEDGEETIGKALKRRKMGVDYTMFLSDKEIISGATLEKLNKAPQIDLNPFKIKDAEQKSVVVLPKYIALFQKGISFAKKTGQKIIKPVFAQTEVVKVVDPDNGDGTDYTSLNAWEAQNRDLVTANEIEIAKCRSTGGSADTVAVRIDGWTTDATRYIKIWTDPAEEYRHNGVWDNTKYRHLATAPVVQYRGMIDIADDYVNIDGLQIDYTVNLYHGRGMGISNGAGTFRISNNIIRNSAATKTQDYQVGFAVYSGVSGGPTNTTYFFNNIIYGFSGNNNNRGMDENNSNSTNYIYNNTISANRTGVYQTNASRTHVINSVVFNNVDDFAGATFGTIDYNASDDGDGTNAVSLNENANGEWDDSFVDRSNNNFSLKLGSLLIDEGTDLSASIDSVDIIGTTRPQGAAWDIGAFEYVAEESAAGSRYRGNLRLRGGRFR